MVAISPSVRLYNVVGVVLWDAQYIARFEDAYKVIKPNIQVTVFFQKEHQMCLISPRLTVYLPLLCSPVGAVGRLCVCVRACPLSLR